MIKANLKDILFLSKPKNNIILCRTQISICLHVCSNYQWKTWVLLKIVEFSSTHFLLNSERGFEPQCSGSHVDVENGTSSIPWMTLICFRGICMYLLLWSEMWNSWEPVSTPENLSCTICSSSSWKDFLASVRTLVFVACSGERNVDSSSSSIGKNWMFVLSIQSIQTVPADTYWKITNLQ